VRSRVGAARDCAASRGVSANRQLTGEQLDLHAPLTTDGRALLRDHLGSGRLSMRGAQRVRAVALTLGDLAGLDGPLDVDRLQQALVLRGAAHPGAVPA
jgi:magnesium chelatase family protein